MNTHKILDVEIGCGKDLGDVHCGHADKVFNEQRGIYEIVVYYCKKCAKKIQEQIEKEEKQIDQAEYYISNEKDEGRLY